MYVIYVIYIKETGGSLIVTSLFFKELLCILLLIITLTEGHGLKNKPRVIVKMLSVATPGPRAHYTRARKLINIPKRGRR
jgi:uncharacterized membrane protein